VMESKTTVVCFLTRYCAYGEKAYNESRLKS